jgi:metallo-beta-lactamase class B
MRFQPFMRFCTFCLLFSMGMACQVTEIKTRSDRSDITLTPITSHVWRHTTYKEFPQWGKVPANGLVVVNNGDAIMIDTPWNDSQTAELLDLIQDKLNASVSKVIVTHFHEDCMGGLGEMHRREIESYSSSLTKVFTAEKKLPLPQIGFQTRLTMSYANITLEASYFGGGHTHDNIVVYIPEENVLFGGCLIKAADAKNIGNRSDADMQAWPETLKKVYAAYPSDIIVVPGHGEIGGRDLIEHTFRLVMDENSGMQSARPSSVPSLSDDQSKPGKAIKDYKDLIQ